MIRELLHSFWFMWLSFGLGFALCERRHLKNNGYMIPDIPTAILGSVISMLAGPINVGINVQLDGHGNVKKFIFFGFEIGKKNE